MLTGRELMLYILEHGLENEPVFKDGCFIGFITELEAARILDVGTATIRSLVKQGKIENIQIGEKIYIPANFKVS